MSTSLMVRLFMFNNSESKLAYLFGFYDTDNDDPRTRWPDHSIKILKKHSEDGVESYEQALGERGGRLARHEFNIVAAEAAPFNSVDAALAWAKDNGIVSNDNYTGQNWSEVPCIMVECGYMSNKEEDVKLNTPEYQQKLA